MRPISKCLNTRLSHICLEAIKLEELSHLVIHHLPLELQSHCRVGSFRSGKLILIATNSAWATSLRFVIPELRDMLRSKGGLHELAIVEIKVQM